MKKESSLPVRLDPSVSKRLDAACARLKINKSALIRILAEVFVDYYEAQGGRIVMPPEFQQHIITEKKGNGK